MGDVGARLLAKALQINNKLRTIILDRNNITLQGEYICDINESKKKIDFQFHHKRFQRHCLRLGEQLQYAKHSLSTVRHSTMFEKPSRTHRHFDA